MRNLFTSTLIATAMAATAVASEAAPVTARSADSVVDSIGVNVHLGYDDRVYNEFPRIKAGLQELGIRHYRDGLENPAFKGHIKKRHNELGRAGIRGTFLAGLPIEQVLAAADLVADSLEAFEGQNEILNIYVKWDDAKRDAARKHQRELYKTKPHPNGATHRSSTQARWDTVKASPNWRDTPVIGPSAVGHEGYVALGNLSAYMDIGNAHAYPLGPAPAVPESNYFKELASAGIVAPGKPMMVTETGYQTGDNKEGNQRVSLAASGKYAPRLFLENFNRGILRSFWYELINQGTDQGQESNFGLLNKDFSLKPSGLAVKNLIALLGEARYNDKTRKWEQPNPAFKPGSLDFTLSGDMANVHSTLLQKSNGKFYLCLWQEVPSYNHDNAVEADIAVTPVPISLHFATPIAAAALYAPTKNTEAAPLAVDKNRIALNVPDEVVILELTPKKVAPKKAALKKAAPKKKKAAPKATSKRH